jgi:predicted GNAT family N-acyltransferase
VAYSAQHELLGYLNLTPLSNSEAKMRQVAVAPAAQGRGVGKALVAYSEAVARRAGFQHITLHARETAVPFYLNLGYQKVGEAFEEVGLPHWKMEKKGLAL